MTEKEITQQSSKTIALQIKEEILSIQSDQQKPAAKYTIHDFTQYNNEKFIVNIFQNLLQRLPSDQEKKLYLSLLYSGERSKGEILAGIRFSKEGRKHNIEILGIKKRYFLAKLYRIPMIGSILKLFVTLIRLPKRINAFEAYSHAQFEALETVQTNFSDLYADYTELKTDYTRLKTDYLHFKAEHEVHEIPDSLEEEMDDFYHHALSQLPTQIEKKSFDQKSLYYSLFEHAFYNHEAVMQKQKIYIKYIPDFNSKENPHLDVGCGRGELLDILQSSGSVVKGIDINPIEIEILQKKGYDAEHTDMLTYLKHTDEKYSSISALQVIEHLEYKTLRKFIKFSHKTLAKNGTIILETINPHNAFTLGSFYMDETHVRLLPPEMVAFMLQWYGFKDIKIVYSSPMPARLRYNVPGRDYHDYTLIGYKR